MSNNKKQSGGLSSWIFPIFMLMVFPPVGVLLLVLTALGGSKKTARGRHPYYSQQQAKKSGPVGARTTGASSQSASHRQTEIMQQKQITALSKKGKRLTTIGSVIAGLFGLCTVISAVDSLWILPDIAWYLSEVIPLLCFTTGGLGCLWAGRRKQKKARRFRNYLAMIGLKKAVSIPSLASASGISVDQVREDLEDMLSDGLFPEGFLDYGKDRLVLSGDGLVEEEPKKAAATQADKENAILAEIRQVNDAIDNEKLSAQIDRIGVITAKILDYQKSHPEKAPQLHSFLSYYLPTTLKILRAYGQLEAQEVAGENITAAMQRIEGMMDKVVEGFEKQLDLLFQGDAMDIATDVDVLERMLAKDGLAGQQGMTLGL